MENTRKTMIITGASSGIGAATARLAAESGYDLVIGYRSDSDGANGVAHDARSAGAQAHLIQADLSDPAGVEQFFAEFDDRFSRLDVLVNNAGIVDVPARVQDMTYDRLRQMFDTNLIGPILVAGQAVRRMSTEFGHVGGVIVNTSSVAATLGSGGQYVDYAASKAAIDTLTKGLSNEVAEQGIRVVAVRPGLIETPIHAKGGQPGRAQRLSHMVPMKRVGAPAEIAEAILWLSSEKAAYITGTTLDVSGGR